MKRFIKIAVTLVFFLVLAGSNIAQTPTYSCVATADTLMTSKIYQFDIYIYRTGSTELYLNNFQLSFKISNTAGIRNGGTVTGAYVDGSSELPAEFTPGGISMFNVGGTLLIRVNGCGASSNGTLVPITGLKIGSFRFTNTNDYGVMNPGTIWWNTIATTHMYAIVPPATTGDVAEITNLTNHTTLFTDPIFNAPVTPFNMTGTGSYCSGGNGLPVALDGSASGIQYRLSKDGTPVGSYIPGTGFALSFGNQTAGVYTASGYRKATYLTENMNGSAVVSMITVNPSISGNNLVCAASTGNVYTTETGMTNYSWNVSAGGSITSGTGTDAITVTWNTAGAQTVSVSYTNLDGCTPLAPAVQAVTVNPLPAAVAGTNRSICLNSGTQIGASAVSGSTYSWSSVPAGFTSAEANPTVSPAGTTTYIVTETITATGCTNSNNVVVTVNSLPAAAAGAARAICTGTETQIGAVPVSGNTYSWTSNPPGYSSTLANPTVTPLVNTTYTLTETITATGCFNSNSVTVTVNPLPGPAGTITGPSTVQQGQTGVIYSIDAITNATGYSWILPTGAAITAGSNTNSITVNFATNAISGIMSVAGTNTCGNGTSSPDFNITVTPLVPVTLDLTNIIVGNGQINCYDATQTITVAGNTNNFIVVSGGSATLIAGMNIRFLPGTIVLNGGYLHGYITTTGTYCGAHAPAIVNTAAEIQEGLPGSGAESDFFKVYPNPTNDKFTLETTAEDESVRQVVLVYSMIGSLVVRDEVKGSIKKEYSLANQPVGIYIVRVIKDGRSGTVKVVKNN
ncbi:MAG: T9SS type A sorting domain-containing protein [Bacteroidota bacterium]